MKRIALRCYLRLTVAASVLFVLGTAPVGAQDSGSIAGRAVEAINQGALPGAMVVVVGTRLETTTDIKGAFRIDNVPAGAQTVLISYLGYGAAQEEVTVVAGQVANITVEMTLRFEETVSVVGDRIVNAQAAALNQQYTAANITNVVSADQIGNFPDPNAAEATQRIPGISVQRDQGEGRYVLVRGTEARLNSMTINGERIPAPEGEIRNVAIDVIPTDLLQAIEVSKALRPDMDADAIGGAVNLVTKSAPEETRLQFTLGGGYNGLTGFHSGSTNTSTSYNQFNGALTAGKRFADGKLGLLVSASTSSNDRNSENFEAEYDDGDLDELQNRYYEINRKRSGINAAMDFRAGDNSTFTINTVYNRYRDYEYRWRQRSRVGKESIELDIKDRDSIQNIFNIHGTGQHYLGGSGGVLDYKLSFSQSGEKRPDELNSIFEQEDVLFDPNVSADFIDPNNIRANPLNADINEFALDAIEYNNDETRDRDVVAAMNYLMPLPSGDQFNGNFKFGAKFRNKDIFQHQPLTLYESDDDIMITDVLGFQPPPIIDGRYDMSPFQDPDTIRSRYTDLDSEHDPESDAGNYDASENIVAGYAMTDFNLNPKVRIMGGLRYEHTSNDYTGFTVLFDDEGDHEETVPISNSSSYGTFSPMVHLTYHLADRTNLRMALTRTLSRPNYYDLVPYNIVIREDNEIERGNPDLKPTTAWNFDVLAEHYLETVGVISGGFFYKSLDQYIYLFTLREEIDDSIWEISQPRNGESAKILGAELALQAQLRFLPSPFDGFGVYTNYTYTDSEAVFPDRDLVSTLPGQSSHVGNFAVWYEKGGFNGRVSVNFHGKYIDEVGGDELEDIYYDNHNQLDISLSQAIGSKVRIFADFINLTNEPLRYYIGTSDRPIQEEYYRWWMNFGIKFNWY